MHASEAAPARRRSGSTVEAELDPVLLPGTPFSSVGSLLREAREASDGNLLQISAALRIRPDHLRAIENGSYADLPAPAYAIGFIRSYAGHLGLDPGEMVRRFKQETEGHLRAPELALPQPLPTRKVSLGGALVGCGILALCAVGAWTVIHGDRGDRDAVASVPAPALVGPPPSAAASPTSATKTAEMPGEALSSLSPAAGKRSLPQVHSDMATAHASEVTTALNSPAPVQAASSAGAGDRHIELVLRATAESWLEVKDGDTSIFRKLLQPGDEYPLPDKPGLTLHIGNAHGIEVLADGKPLPVADQPSQGHRVVVTLQARELIAKAGAQ